MPESRSAADKSLRCLEDRGYRTVTNPDVGVKPRIAAAIQHPPPANQYVEGLALGRIYCAKQCDNQSFGNVFHSHRGLRL